jgi:hypothetical protein
MKASHRAFLSAERGGQGHYRRPAESSSGMWSLPNGHKCYSWDDSVLRELHSRPVWDADYERNQ